jgi:WD40 repeat protein/predicted Ser/Thr protein kinase
MPLAAGSRLGPYEVVDLLGAGGMGEVYRARDPRLGREVAIKVLPERLGDEPDRRQRFEREARAAGALNHPNIVTVFDVGSEDGRPYVVCELLEGETLRERIGYQPTEVGQALEFVLQIARGLACAHQAGIIHRDLKPENTLLTRDGRVKILDFGLAKLVQPDRNVSADARTPTADTGADGPVGTAAYMSPEQIRYEPLDGRADLFAVGAILYELVSRQRAFPGATASDVMAAILRDVPPSFSELGVGAPPGVEALVRRCLEKRREDRFGSAQELAAAVAALQDSLGGARPGAVADEERSPYPGLRSFTESEAAVFFGREVEVESLWARLRARPLLAVIGASGAGKTSFVRAGVLPARPKGWGAVACAPGSAPLVMLGQALAPELAGDPEALRQLVRFDDPAIAFAAMSRWRQRQGNALLVVDQFEELFTLNPPEVQQRFAGLLGRLASEAGVHVLLSLRDDFLMRCHEHPDLSPVFSDLTPLGPPTGEELRRALVEPAARRGVRFEDDALVDELMGAVRGERGALPLLAFAMARLWERRDRQRRILTRASYEQIGGVAGCLAQHAEATIEQIGPEGQAIVRDLFRSLVTADGTRAVMDRAELVSASSDRGAAEDVLGRLIAARLLTSYEVPARGGAATTRQCVEIVHESLLGAWPRLVQWQAQDTEGALFRDQLRRAARLWQERGRPPELLWTGRSYREFALWRERYPAALTAVEEGFAAAMSELAQRSRRRRRHAVAASFGALLAVLVTLGALWRRSENARAQAVREARIAQASRLVAIGRTELDRFPTAGLAYARRSLEVADTAEARSLVMEALWRGPTARTLALEGQNSYSLAFGPDGEWMATFPNGKQVLLYRCDGSPGRRMDAHRAPVSPPLIGFTPRGDALYTMVRGDPGVRLLSARDGSELRWLKPHAAGGSPQDLVFLEALAEGASFLVRAPERSHLPDRIEIWPWDGGPPDVVGSVLPAPRDYRTSGFADRLPVVRGQRILLRPLAGPPSTPEREVARLAEGAPSSLALSPRGDWLAVAEETGRLTLWRQGGPEPRETRVLRMPHPEPLFPVRFSSDGSRIAWGSSVDRVTLLWDLDGPPDADPVTLRMPESDVTALGQFTPGDDWLAVANRWGFNFWAVRQPQMRILRGHTKMITRLAFTPDSMWLLSCGGNDAIRRWSLDAKGGPAATLPLEVGSCRSLAISPDGQSVLQGGTLGAYLGPLAGGSGRWLVRSDPELSPIFSVAIDGSGRWAAAAPREHAGEASDKLLRVFDLRSGAARTFPLVPPGETVADTRDWGLNTLGFTDSGQVLGAGPRGVRRFDLQSGRSEWLWSLGKKHRPWIAVSSDGRSALVVSVPFEISRGESTLAYFDLRGGGAPRMIRSHGDPNGGGVTLDRSGSTIVTVDLGGVVRVGRKDGGEPHLLFGGSSGGGVAISPDGRWIATGSGSEIRLWPMPDLSRPPLHTLPLPELLTKLNDLTNYQVVGDGSAPGKGYRVEAGAFPGWKTPPTW